MRKSRLTLKNTLALFALVPLTVGMIILAVFSVFEMTNNLKETTFEELNLAAQGLKSYYEYDLINDNDLEDGFIGYAPEDYIDVVHDTIGVDLTLFRDNVRFMTSLRQATAQSTRLPIPSARTAISRSLIKLSPEDTP